MSAFREIICKCLTCGAEKWQSMQCEVGMHDWPCDICGGTTIHRVSTAPPVQVLLYFGCIGQTGHYLFIEGEASLNSNYAASLAKSIKGLNPMVFLPSLLDGFFVPTGAGYRESIIPPVRIVSWIDNSVDHRGGSHSTFVGYGYRTAEELLDDAVVKFPSVMKRQQRPKPEVLP
jgi:hypothetical protein